MDSMDFSTIFQKGPGLQKEDDYQLVPKGSHRPCK